MQIDSRKLDWLIINQKQSTISTCSFAMHCTILLRTDVGYYYYTRLTASFTGQPG